MSTQTGWVAECQTCPTTTGEYGEPIKVHQEFPPDDEQAAHLWALMHSAADLNAWHQVIVKRFWRTEIEIVGIDREALRLLFGMDE